MITIEAFSYRYPQTERPALEHLDLEIPLGQFCAVSGANGAGKSTLCYAIGGFVPDFFGGQAKGQVLVNDPELGERPPSQLIGRIAMVFDDPFNQISGARFSVREEVAFGLENLGVARVEMDARIDQALSDVGLLELGERSPFALSGGQQQRLAIASVLVMQPAVLILDEPTSHLDPIGTRQLLQVLEALTADRGTTVVLVESRPEWLAQHADRVILLAEGRIVADGAPRQVLASEGALQYGLRPAEFTLAARELSRRGLVSRHTPLPVTLDEAVEFMQ